MLPRYNWTMLAREREKEREREREREKERGNHSQTILKPRIYYFFPTAKATFIDIQRLKKIHGHKAVVGGWVGAV